MPARHWAFDRELAWLVSLAKKPEWKAWAWHHAKALDADRSRLYAGMADALKAAMTGPDAAKESEGQEQTKPH
jgi:hypothetical protein